jgi:hypothetical protein
MLALLLVASCSLALLSSVAAQDANEGGADKQKYLMGYSLFTSSRVRSCARMLCVQEGQLSHWWRLFLRALCVCVCENTWPPR